MGEILLIAVVALLFLGPEKLPDAAKTISKGIRDFRKQTRELQQIVEDDNEIGGAIRDIKSALRGEDLEAAERRRRVAEATRRAAENAAKAAEEMAKKQGAKGPETLSASAADATSPDGAPDGPGPDSGDHDGDSDDDRDVATMLGMNDDDGPAATGDPPASSIASSIASPPASSATESTPAASESEPPAEAAASTDASAMFRPAQGALAYAPVPLFADTAQLDESAGAGDDSPGEDAPAADGEGDA